MLVYAPSSVRATVRGGNEVALRAVTNYPLEDDVRIEIEESDNATFPLHLRVPSWSANAKVSINGAPQELEGPGSILIIDRTWKTGDVVTLELPSEVELSRWHEGSVAVNRGPLLFALPIEGQVQEVPALTAGMNTDQMEEVHPQAAWNYGLIADPDNASYRFDLERVDRSESYPWNESNVPVRLRVSGVRVPDWKTYNDVAGPMPPSPVRLEGGRVESLTLIPYGATTLRVASFPEVSLR
jgi:DUF1680 family protein